MGLSQFHKIYGPCKWIAHAFLLLQLNPKLSKPIFWHLKKCLFLYSNYNYKWPKYRLLGLAIKVKNNLFNIYLRPTSKVYHN